MLRTSREAWREINACTITSPRIVDSLECYYGFRLLWQQRDVVSLLWGCRALPIRILHAGLRDRIWLIRGGTSSENRCNALADSEVMPLRPNGYGSLGSRHSRHFVRILQAVRDRAILFKGQFLNNAVIVHPDAAGF